MLYIDCITVNYQTFTKEKQIANFRECFAVHTRKYNRYNEMGKQLEGDDQNFEEVSVTSSIFESHGSKD